MNKELKRNTQQRGRGALEAWEKVEEQGAAFHANFH
jgi:hypothetical protein